MGYASLINRVAAVEIERGLVALLHPNYVHPFEPIKPQDNSEDPLFLFGSYILYPHFIIEGGIGIDYAKFVLTLERELAEHGMYEDGGIRVKLETARIVLDKYGCVVGEIIGDNDIFDIVRAKRRKKLKISGEDVIFLEILQISLP